MTDKRQICKRPGHSGPHHGLRLTAGGTLERSHGGYVWEGAEVDNGCSGEVGGPGPTRRCVHGGPATQEQKTLGQHRAVGWTEAGLCPEVQGHKGVPENAEQSVHKHPPGKGGPQLSFSGWYVTLPTQHFLPAAPSYNYIP